MHKGALGVAQTCLMVDFLPIEVWEIEEHTEHVTPPHRTSHQPLTRGHGQHATPLCQVVCHLPYALLTHPVPVLMSSAPPAGVMAGGA